MPYTISAQASGDLRRQAPELRARDDDLVAGLQPDARLAGAADAGRRPGGDDVAGLERHQRREVGEQLGDREDEVRGRRLLHPLAVEVERDPDRVGGPGLVGGDDRRAAGRAAVEHLARHPLRRRELEVARREVVEQRVAGDVGDRVRLGDVLRAGADDERDLGLVVDLAARGRQLDRRAVGAQRVSELREEGRARRRLEPRLGGVGAVVEPDADDLVGVRDRGQELDLGERELVAVGVGEVADASAPEQLAHRRAAAGRRRPRLAAARRAAAGDA